jgi:O-antigen/teichoic acid export membrane protein
MIQNTQGLFGVLAGTGLGLAATKFVAEYRSVDPVQANRCIVLTMLASMIAGLLGSLFMLFGADVVASTALNAPHLVAELQVATGLILFSSINGVQSGALAGLGEFRAVAHINIFRGGVLFVALLFGVWTGGVMGGVVGLLVTEVLAVGLSQFALVRAYPMKWRGTLFDPSGFKQVAIMLRFSGLAISASLATTLAFWFVNVLLVKEENGYASLGIFNAADRWRQLLLFLPATFSQLLLSMLSNMHGEKETDEFRKVLSLSLWVNIVVVALPTLCLIMFASLAMNLFGMEYRSGSMTLAILSGSTVAVVLNNVLGQVLISKGAMIWRFAMDLLLSIVLVVVAWVLVPVWREQGLAISYLFAYGVTATALIPLAIRYSRDKKE